MSSWAELIAKSTAAVGSDAWEHLISDAPGGGGGETIILEGARTMDIASPGLDMIVGNANLNLEVGEQSIAMVESSSDMVIDIDDRGMTLGD